HWHADETTVFQVEAEQFIGHDCFSDGWRCLHREQARRKFSAVHFFLCLPRFSSQRANDGWLSPDGLPSTSPSTLMSSSKSGQWMPSPRPMKRQRLRSLVVPCSRRGNHTS